MTKPKSKKGDKSAEDACEKARQKTQKLRQKRLVEIDACLTQLEKL